MFVFKISLYILGSAAGIILMVASFSAGNMVTRGTVEGPGWLVWFFYGLTLLFLWFPLIFCLNRAKKLVAQRKIGVK